MNHVLEGTSLESIDAQSLKETELKEGEPSEQLQQQQQQQMPESSSQQQNQRTAAESGVLETGIVACPSDRNRQTNTEAEQKDCGAVSIVRNQREDQSLAIRLQPIRQKQQQTIAVYSEVNTDKDPERPNLEQTKFQHQREEIQKSDLENRRMPSDCDIADLANSVEDRNEMETIQDQGQLIKMQSDSSVVQTVTSRLEQPLSNPLRPTPLGVESKVQDQPQKQQQLKQQKQSVKSEALEHFHFRRRSLLLYKEANIRGIEAANHTLTDEEATGAPILLESEQGVKQPQHLEHRFPTIVPEPCSVVGSEAFQELPPENQKQPNRILSSSDHQTSPREQELWKQQHTWRRQKHHPHWKKRRQWSDSAVLSNFSQVKIVRRISSSYSAVANVATTGGLPQDSVAPTPQQLQQLQRTIPAIFPKTASSSHVYSMSSPIHPFPSRPNHEIKRTRSQNGELSSSFWKIDHTSSTTPEASTTTTRKLSGSNYVISPQITIVRSSLERQKQAKLQAALQSLNRFDFESLGLVGRQPEIETLKQCLQRLVHKATFSATEIENKNNNNSELKIPSVPLCSIPSRHELILISGESGVGKTSLARTLKRELARLHFHRRMATTRGAGIFVRGKHDLQRRDHQPFAGLGIACNELCRHVLSLAEQQEHQLAESQESDPKDNMSSSKTAATSSSTISTDDKEKEKNLHSVEREKQDDKGKSTNERRDQLSSIARVISQEILSSMDAPLLHLLQSLVPLFSNIVSFSNQNHDKAIPRKTAAAATASKKELRTRNNDAQSKAGRRKKILVPVRTTTSLHENNNKDSQNCGDDHIKSKDVSVQTMHFRPETKMSSSIGKRRHHGTSLTRFTNYDDTTNFHTKMGTKTDAPTAISNATAVFDDSGVGGSFSGSEEPIQWTRISKNRTTEATSATVDASAEIEFATTEGDMDIDNSAREEDQIDLSQSKVLLQFAVRNFLRIFASRLGPIVLVMDDLQWADQASLDMIKSIVNDTTIPNLMVVGCYRSDIVHETHVLRKAIQEFRSGAKMLVSNAEQGEQTFCDSENRQHDHLHQLDKYEYNMTEIAIGNLSSESVTEIIVQLLSVPLEKARGLANICYKRTLGNVYFVKEFLILLNELDILQFEVGTFQWTWNEQRVEQETAATFNVVSVIKMKIDKYSDGMVLLLSVAACLGYIFDSGIIKLLWSRLDGKYKGTSEDVDKLLEAATNDTLIEPVAKSLYRFVHDKVQETAMLLIPDDESAGFRSDIGKCLYQNLADHDLENMLFVVTDLLNGGDSAGVEMAALNASAAEKARELSAFHTSASYVEKGIENLSSTSDIWAEHPKLALLLYSIGAEVKECEGDSEKSHWYCSEVQKQVVIPIVDKMPVISTVVERLYSDGRYEELWSVGLDTLQQLGCNLPRKRSMQKCSAAVAMVETKRYHLPRLREVKLMDFVDDPVKRETIAFMIKLASFCLGSKNKPLYILLCCRFVYWTKSFGLTSYTASGFASFANVLMHEYDDWKTALQIAETALQIEKRLGSNYTKASTLHKITTFVLGWAKPLRTCRSNYLEAYRVGMLSGNIGSVGMAVLFYLISEFYSGGIRLQGIDEDLQNYIAQLENLKLHTFVLGLRLLWQKVLNLMGASRNPNTTTLEGTAMSGINVDMHPMIFKTVSQHHVCNLCAYFSEYKSGSEIALSMGDQFYGTWSGAAYFGFEPFSRALCLYAMAIDTGKRKYLKSARRGRRMIASWVRSGAINLVHQLLILDAEEAVIKRTKKQIHKAYRLAISTAVRGGFLQDSGIVNERYATYLLNRGMTDDAAFYMKKSIQCFAEWGAARKVQQLLTKYGILFNINLTSESFVLPDSFCLPEDATSTTIPVTAPLVKTAE